MNWPYKRNIWRTVIICIVHHGFHFSSTKNYAVITALVSCTLQSVRTFYILPLRKGQTVWFSAPASGFIRIEFNPFIVIAAFVVYRPVIRAAFVYVNGEGFMIHLLRRNLPRQSHPRLNATSVHPTGHKKKKDENRKASMQYFMKYNA